MLKLLLKNNLAGVFSRMIGGRKGRKGIAAALFGLLMAYVIGVMAWIFYQLFKTLAPAMHTGGLDWLYFSMAFVVVFAVTFILSIFAMKNQLYEAKDNDLLLCLPIEPKTILSARLASIGLLNFGTGLVVFVPALLVWKRSCGFALSGFIYTLILYVGMTLFVLALSALFGWLLSLVTSSMRRKSLFDTLFSLAFIALYFYLYAKAADIVTGVIQNGEVVAASFGSVAPVYWLGAAAADGDLGCFLPSLGLFVIPYLIVKRILSRTFIKTATAKRGMAKIKYKGGPQKVSSLGSALLQKESKRFFASSIYTMNSGLGAIFILVGTVALVLFRDKLNTLIVSFSQVADVIVPLCTLAMGFMAGMCVPTCASVSMEGKNLWITQSMPIPTVKLLMTKLKFSLILYLPVLLLNTAVVCLLFKPGFMTALMSFILSAAMICAMSAAGLVINLKLPKLDWATETQAVKQSAAVLVSMLVNFGLILLVGYGAYKMQQNGIAVQTILLAADAFFVLLSAVLFGWLRGRGAKLYARL